LSFGRGARGPKARAQSSSDSRSPKGSAGPSCLAGPARSFTILPLLLSLRLESAGACHACSCALSSLSSHRSLVSLSLSHSHSLSLSPCALHTCTAWHDIRNGMAWTQGWHGHRDDMDTGMAWTQDGMDTGMARTPQHAGHARPVHDLMHGRAPSACSPLQLTETRAVRVSLAF
jgi:hypothetical protein